MYSVYRFDNYICDTDDLCGWIRDNVPPLENKVTHDMFSHQLHSTKKSELVNIAMEQHYTFKKI